MSRTARGGLAHLLQGLLIALLCVVLATPVYADPTAGPERSSPLPVKVQFTEISPTLSQGDEPIHITATLTNTGHDAITAPWIRLQRDARVTERAQLQKLDNHQPSYTSWISAEQTIEQTFEPGKTYTVELTVERKALGITDTGAYPIMLNVQGSIDGLEGRVGQAAFTLPRTATDTAAPISVSWVLPLIDRPHRLGAADTFTDDELATLISPGGRLDNILSAVEKYPAAAPTLVIDPELVDELVAMSDGYKVASDSTATVGKGADAAAGFLDRLRVVAETTPVIATPYADVDSVALVRSGLASVLLDARTRGAEVLADALKTTPITDIAWPADGIMTDATAQALRGDGVTRFLLSGASFGQDDYLESDDGITESAATKLPDGTAIVADPGLTRLLTEAPSYAAGPVAATQRIAAELAVIAAEAPQRSRNVVLLPPRNWQPSAALLDDLMALTTQNGWVTPITVDAVAQGAPQDRGTLQYPASMSNLELPAAQIDRIRSPLAQIGELETAFDAADADEAFGPIKAIVYRSVSSAWRTDSQRVGAGAASATAAVAGLRAQIRIITPAGGTYTLASSDAPLVLTIENGLPWPVHYRVGVDERHSTGLTTKDIGVQTIPGGSRATVQLPATVERSGSFTVVAQISTPDGKPLGNDVRINVSSSAYGTAALWVTGLAFAALIALIARRWWRRHLFWAQERAKRDAALEHQRLEAEELAQLADEGNEVAE